MKNESVLGMWFSLALMDLRLRLFPHSLNRELLRADQPADPASVDASRKEEILMIARLVGAVARHPFVFNMSCLRQALVIRFKLRSRGIPAALVYGVRMNAGEFGAHAWVEAGGMSVNGAPDDLYHRFDNGEQKP